MSIALNCYRQFRNFFSNKIFVSQQVSLTKEADVNAKIPRLLMALTFSRPTNCL